MSCPSCGYCSHCGRGASSPYPYAPAPYYRPIQYGTPSEMYPGLRPITTDKVPFNVVDMWLKV